MQYYAYGEQSSGSSRWTIRTGLSSDVDAETGTGGGVLVQMRQPKFIAVGDGGKGMYSLDGKEWKATDSIGTNQNWRSIVYAYGKYMTVAGTGTPRFASSDNGETSWVVAAGTLTNTIPWYGMAYGDKTVIAVSNDNSSTNSGTIAYSLNGTAFTEKRVSTGANDAVWYGTAYGNGAFVAVGKNKTGTQLRISFSGNKGVTWPDVTHNGPLTDELISVTFGNGMFVAVGVNGLVSTSPDGRVWTSIANCITTTDQKWHQVCYGKGTFVAVAESGSSDQGAWSPDGINWTVVPMPNATGWRGITYGNGMFVAVGMNGNAAYSIDGKSWTPATTSVPGTWYNVVYGSAGVSTLEDVRIGTN
jgi:hypothetical protein